MLDKIKQLGIILLLIAASYFTVRFFSARQGEFIDKVELYNLEQIPQKEIIKSLISLDNADKSLLEINAKQIAQYLEKRPLVRNAKVRTLLFPTRKYKVYINEESPWAFYRGKIFDSEAKLLVNSASEAQLYESDAVVKLYDDFYKGDSKLVHLRSYKEMEAEQITKVHDISALIDHDLQLISEDDEIESIVLDRENNLSVFSKQLWFKLGIFDDEIAERAQKLDLVISKINEVRAREELAYVDLSLKTGEVILGKAK